MSKIKYIIFDFDGTIADTIDLAINIYNGISSEYTRDVLSAMNPDQIADTPEYILKCVHRIITDR